TGPALVGIAADKIALNAQAMGAPLALQPRLPLPPGQWVGRCLEVQQASRIISVLHLYPLHAYRADFMGQGVSASDTRFEARAARIKTVASVRVNSAGGDIAGIEVIGFQPLHIANTAYTARKFKPRL